MAQTITSKNRSVISDGQMTTALKHIGAEITHGALRSSVLARVMRETYHGSDVAGAWDWRMAYDMMQAAAVLSLLGDAPNANELSAAKHLASRLLTETRRSEQ